MNENLITWFRWLLVSIVAGAVGGCGPEPKLRPVFDSDREPQTYVVGISPFGTLSYYDQFLDCLTMALTGKGFLENSSPSSRTARLGPGDVVHVYDAYQFNKLATIEMPQEPKYFASDNTLVDMLKQPYQRLLTALEQLAEKKSDVAKPFVRIPEFLREVSDQLYTGDNQPPIVLIYGSALYNRIGTAPGAEDFSMLDRVRPRDGNLVASEMNNPFGISRDRAKLRDIEVYFAYLRDDFGDDTEYKNAISRWWHLWIGEEQGRLNIFTTDLSLAMSRAIENTVSGDRLEHESDPAETGQGMVTIGDPDRGSRPPLLPDRPEHSEELVTGLEIRIRWSGPAVIFCSFAPNAANPRSEELALYGKSCEFGSITMEKSYDWSDPENSVLITCLRPVALSQARAYLYYFAGSSFRYLNVDIEISGHNLPPSESRIVFKVDGTDFGEFQPPPEHRTGPHWRTVNLADYRTNNSNSTSLEKHEH